MVSVHITKLQYYHDSEDDLVLLQLDGVLKGICVKYNRIESTNPALYELGFEYNGCKFEFMDIVMIGSIIYCDVKIEGDIHRIENDLVRCENIRYNRDNPIINLFETRLGDKNMIELLFLVNV